MNKKDKVLAHLKIHGTITPLEALEKYGSFRLADIIWDLKNEGYNITTIIQHGKRYAKYTLHDDAQIKMNA